MAKISTSTDKDGNGGTTTPAAAVPPPPPLRPSLSASDVVNNPADDGTSTTSMTESVSGFFRGVAAATRKAALVAKKAAIAKSSATKQVVRAIGENRALAFASEGAVAGDAMIPRWVFYGAWGLSGLAITADIYNKYEDAPTPLKTNTAIYWTTFHIPASLIIPAAIIHQVVHYTEKMVQNPKGMKMVQNLPPRAKAVAPVVAAMLSIIPVVPAVDYAAEAILEPTLGDYLGVQFHHHHHMEHPPTPTKTKEA